MTDLRNNIECPSLSILSNIAPFSDAAGLEKNRQAAASNKKENKCFLVVEGDV